MTDDNVVDIGAMLKAAGERQRAQRRAANGTPPPPPLRAEYARPGLDPYAAAAVAAELARLDALDRPWHEGAGWDTTTFEVACNLIEIANSGWGYTLAQAEADLHAHAPSDAVWGAREIPAKWNSARNRVGTAGRVRTPLATNVTEVDASEFGVSSATPAPPPIDEAAFWAERPVLAHLHTFAKARHVSPWGVLGVALARVVTATPPEVCLPAIIGGRASLNSFVGLVGGSGDGKGACEATAVDALHVGHIRTARIASGEAIAHVYKRREKGSAEPVWRDDSHSALIMVAEIDRLAGQAGRQGSTIMADLRSAWSGELLGQVAADSTRSIPLEAHQYRLCLVAGIQPARAGCLLDDADGGTPQRFLWFPVTDPEAVDVAPSEPKPWTWTMPSIAAIVGYHGAQLDVCETARETIVSARLARLRGQGDALDGHLLLAQLKTAAALALLDERTGVADDDWRLAGLVIAKSLATRTEVVATLQRAKHAETERKAQAEAHKAVVVADRLAEEGLERVARAVRRRLARETDWLPQRAVKNALASRDRAMFDAAVERLIHAGQIEVEKAGKGTKIRLRGDS